MYSSHFVFLTLLCLFQISKSQQLTVKYSAAKLPFAERCHRLHYDGHDSIFILGGCYYDNGNQILKYSLTTDSISQIGTLPENLVFGSLVSDSDGNLFLFGSGDGRNQVIKYDINKNESAIVATLPYRTTFQPSVSCGENKAYILGGESQAESLSILTFDLQTFQISESLNRLPIEFPHASKLCIDGFAIIAPTPSNQYIWKMETNFENFTFSTIGNIPPLPFAPSAVTNGSLIYLIQGLNPSTNSAEGIISFDPKSKTSRFLPVDNWPVKDGQAEFSFPPQSVFVSKLNRIYCFGGQSSDVATRALRDHDFIFYIEMNEEQSSGVERVKVQIAGLMGIFCAMICNKLIN